MSSIGTPPVRDRKPKFVAANRIALLAGVAFFGTASSAWATSCEILRNAQIPKVTIDSATSVPAGTFQPPGSPVAFADLPAFCRVVATVKPVPGSSIGIEVWLPTSTWNGRYQQVGSHGFAGKIYWSEMAPQLRRGFATAATDDGHVNATPNPFDVSWAIGHPVQVNDMAFRAVHETVENAKRLIAAYYGKAAIAAYFNGCSDGGREGLREAHDYPRDFNGVIAGGAATGWTHAATQQLVLTLNLRNSGIQGAAGDAILRLAQKAATAACDAADGVSDGLIGNPLRCRWNPHSLICQAGEDPANCITPQQADALADNIKPVLDPLTHQWVFSGLPPGSDFETMRWGYENALAPFGLANYQVAFANPSWDGSTFNLHTDLPTLDSVFGVYDMTDPDLRPFEQQGGKLIQWHGWNDGAFTAGWTVRYYNEVVAQTGDGSLRRVQDFYRLFMMPGVGHCAPSVDIGPDNIGAENQLAVSPDPRHDIVSALLAWVEHGTAPGELVATKFNGNDPTKGIQMQRPLFPYPAEAVWNGIGDTNEASSFHSSRPNPLP